MGVWLKANGRLEVVPPPDEKLMIDFWHFSVTTRPEEYERTDEYFKNTWFFDENNKLACIAGKFAEPGIWLDWMKKHFFSPKGYQLIGAPDIIGEGDYGFVPLDRESSREYYGWLHRISAMSPKAAYDIHRYYGDLEERWNELEQWRKERPHQLPPPNLI